MKRDYSKCLRYIDKYWDKATFYFPKDKGIFLGVPNKFVSPNHTKFHQDIFYWDTYFIILGLIEAGKIKLAKGMVDNFLFLFKRFHFIPVRNRIYSMVISQPPFLTSMALEIFEVKKNKRWLKKVAEVAEDELNNYWMDLKKIDKDLDTNYKKRNLRHLYKNGLSRYCDHFGTHHIAEHESGWDMTSRFRNKCLDYIPVDLNCLLYKYEIDLTYMFSLLKDKRKEKLYLERAKNRKKNINKLLWNKEKEFFFDYNHEENKQSNFYSLAGFFPLWCGLASKKQAEALVSKLKKFEYKGGLAMTQKTSLLKNRRGENKQWDYPNAWANVQWIVIKGLLNYGFREDAERIALKWLDMNKKTFDKTNNMWEKYDVVKAGVSDKGRYEVQSGFGWTNAVFLKLYKEFIEKSE